MFKKTRFFLLFAVFLVPSESSQSQPCDVLAVSRSAAILEDFDARRATASLVPILNETALTRPGREAPLGAIGKVTYSADSWEDALCTATLIYPDIILTTYHCLDDAHLGGQYFWAASAFKNSAPYGFARIVSKYGSKDLGVAYGKLDRSIPGPGYFSVRFINRYPPKSYFDRPVWNMAGYPKDAPDSLRLDTGISVIPKAVYGLSGKRKRRGGKGFRVPGWAFGGSARGVQDGGSVSILGFFGASGRHAKSNRVSPQALLPKQRRSYERLTPGSILFADLCGVWAIIGMKASRDENMFLHANVFGNLTGQAWKKFGKPLPRQVEQCDKPRSGSLEQ